MNLFHLFLFAITLAGEPAPLLDLNTATFSQLVALPAIGETKAQAILDRREELGGRFASLNDIDSIPGFGETTMRTITPLVTIVISEDSQ